MTRGEAIAMVQQTLGFRGDLTDTIITNLKAAQIQLERSPTKPWFLLSEESATVTTADSHRVAVPTDFICEHEESTLFYRPSDVTEEEVNLGKRDYDWLTKEYPSVYEVDAERTPKYYALRGNYFMIFPKPDAIYTLRMAYYAHDTVLDTDVENNWLKYFPLLLCGRAGMLLAPGLRDREATATFTSWAAQGQSAMYTENELRQHAGRDDYQMGGPE